jgi:hypothetical protein
MGAAMARPVTPGGPTTVTRIGPLPSPPTAPTAPTPTAAPLALSGLYVGSDSVVGTAAVQYTGHADRVTVTWGDGATSTRIPGSSLPMVGAPQDPPGTVTFTHVYAVAAPQFAELITAKVTSGKKSASQSAAISVIPRYRVTQYQASFRPLDHCDPFYETQSEWSITQDLRTDQSDQRALGWEQDRDTNPGVFDFRPLAGSQLSVEETLADPHFFLHYSVEELDTFYNDESGEGEIDLHPSLGSRHVVLHMPGENGDCRSEVEADVDVTLLKPGLTGSSSPVMARS